MKRYEVDVDVRYLSGSIDKYTTHVSASRIDVAAKRAIRTRTGLGRAVRLDLTVRERQA